MDKNTKLMELFENAQFQADIDGLTTPEELQDVFARYGLEMTKDEVINLCAVAAHRTEEGELSEDDLEDVAGGLGPIFWTTVGASIAALVGVYNGYRGRG